MSIRIPTVLVLKTLDTYDVSEQNIYNSMINNARFDDAWGIQQDKTAQMASRVSKFHVAIKQHNFTKKILVAARSFKARYAQLSMENYRFLLQ